MAKKEVVFENKEVQSESAQALADRITNPNTQNVLNRVIQNNNIQTMSKSDFEKIFRVAEKFVNIDEDAGDFFKLEEYLDKMVKLIKSLDITVI